ncbi:MAG: family 43 glycosylhydrolase [Limisphaerales bacterium]
MIQNASAQNWNWTGLANNGLWASPTNWDNGKTVPPTNAETVTLSPANGWSVITIVAGEVENCTTAYSGGMIYGPEFGASLNIYGKLNWNSYLVPVQDDADQPSVLNLYSGSSVSGQGLALGDTWWYWGGPYVTMNMYGTAFAGIDYMYWGGHVNLYGGTLSITNGLTLDTIDSVSDATRSMNIAAGELILPGAFAATVNTWVSRGILLAYGKAQDTADLVISQTAMAGRTVVTTVPLGGSLQNIFLQSFPTNMTVGGIQKLTVLGNYPNVQKVVLTALDPATLPATIVYQSSASNVATIDTNGLVMALAAGTTTLTAQVGQFSSTNSITLTVTPVTIPTPLLPQEQTVLGYTYVHDPSRMIKDGGFYYTFGDGQGINVSFTSDLRNWNYANPVFPGSPPVWTTNAVPGFTGYFWAPDIVYQNGQYYLYYAASIWGTITSAIGLVTTPSLTAPVWTDHGAVVKYESGVAYNCIDPSILQDTNGTMWMSFGSYSDGIFITQLNPATGNLNYPGLAPTKIADSSTNFFSNGTEASFLYQTNGYYYLFLNLGGCCSGINSTYNIRVGRSTSVTGPYLYQDGSAMLGGAGTIFLESSGRFIGPGQAGILNDNGTNWFTYHFYDGNNNGTATLGVGLLTWSAGGWPVFTNDWSAFYPFNVDAREHLGLYDGTLEGGAVITNDPGLGNVLSLNGTSQYVLLPDPVANASTFVTWVKWNGGATWQRIFDFGTNTGAYLFLTPQASSGNMRFAITTNGNGEEQRIEASGPLPSNSWCHVAVTLNGSKGLLYLNGNPIATNSSLTIRPWQTLARSNYIGHSQFSADPLFGGEISSFRIFGRALSGAEIQSLAYAQPPLAHRYSFTSNQSNVWDSIGMAHGTLSGNATITNDALNLPGTSGNYVNLPGGLVSGSGAATIEFWAAFATNGDWAPVFDFGNISGSDGQNYLAFSPHASANSVELQSATTDGTLTLASPEIFDNLSLQVDCIMDPANDYSAIYTNGVLLCAATNTTPPLSNVGTAWSFIGRSLFAAAPWLNATIDEFRIYDGRLTPAEIAANYQFGPRATSLPISLAVSAGASNITLAWPSYAVGYAAQSSPALGANALWSSVSGSPTLASNRWRQTLPTTNRATFLRLIR